MPANGRRDSRSDGDTRCVGVPKQDGACHGAADVEPRQVTTWYGSRGSDRIASVHTSFEKAAGLLHPAKVSIPSVISAGLTEGAEGDSVYATWGKLPPTNQTIKHLARRRGVEPLASGIESPQPAAAAAVLIVKPV